MENQDTQAKRVIGNVGVLDLRNATLESIAAIQLIGNVGVVVCSPETTPLAARLNAGNVGDTLIVSPDTRLRIQNGHQLLTRDYFKELATPVYIVANGHLAFDHDVPLEDIKNGLTGLTVNGHVFYPEHLAGVVQSKIHMINGNTLTYAPGDRLAMGRTRMDEAYVRSLDDGTNLVLAGRLTLPDVLPNELLEQKLRSLKISGRLTVHEENAEVALRLMGETPVQINTQVIPTGHTLVDRPLALDNATLTSLPSRKLYCTTQVQIDANVDANVLDNSLDSLVATDILVAPADFQGVLSRKCNLIETRAVFYDGELWLVENEMEIVPSRFDFLDGKATLVVTGELAIASDVEPSVLADRFAAVHNFGEITCTREQKGAIQARLGLSDGELIDSADADTADEGANAGYLVL